MSIWVIIIAVMVLSFIIQRTLQSKFDKYSDVPAPGGLTGVATILNYLAGWPVGITALVLNIPLFLIISMIDDIPCHHAVVIF